MPDKCQLNGLDIAALADQDRSGMLQPEPFPGCADAVLLHYILHLDRE